MMAVTTTTRYFVASLTPNLGATKGVSGCQSSSNLTVRWLKLPSRKPGNVNPETSRGFFDVCVRPLRPIDCFERIALSRCAANRLPPSKKPNCPILASARSAITHQIRTTHQERLFFEAP
jgi:hypothetical protein